VSASGLVNATRATWDGDLAWAANARAGGHDEGVSVRVESAGAGVKRTSGMGKCGLPWGDRPKKVVRAGQFSMSHSGTERILSRRVAAT
jgi:hypothetical protein